MFNFEEWSERVLEITASMEHPKRSEADIPENQKQLEQLWEEMIHQDSNFHITFLNTLLIKTKDLINGQIEQSRYEQIVEELRENLLKDI